MTAVQNQNAAALAIAGFGVAQAYVKPQCMSTNPLDNKIDLCLEIHNQNWFDCWMNQSYHWNGRQVLCQDEEQVFQRASVPNIIWIAIFEFQWPKIECFSTLVKAKMQITILVILKNFSKATIISVRDDILKSNILFRNILMTRVSKTWLQVS